MITIKGLVVNSGLFIGRIKKIKSSHIVPQFRRISAEDLEQELVAFKKARNTALMDIQSTLNSHQLSTEDHNIIETHLLIIDDPDIRDGIENLIKTKLICAEYAVYEFFSSVIRQFEQMENDFYSQRKADYKDISNRIISNINGDDPYKNLQIEPDSIVVVHEITPSQVTTFAHLGVKAYCCEKGSYNSHSSILSRALNFIALFNLPDLNQSIQDGMLAVLDGIDGKLMLQPDPETLQRYRQLIDKCESNNTNHCSLRNQPAVTRNGIGINLYANLELPQELESLHKLNCDGIGLFRSEFLYLSRNSLPSEDEQRDIYTSVLQAFAPRSVTIRTFDLGGDKLTHLIPGSKDENPYLGCRGIRFSFSQEKLFRTQIRAIMRASVSGNARIMFPMIIDYSDLDRARHIVRSCMQELESEGHVYDKSIPLGVMIEIPSAALCSRHLAEHCDFFSIGTNDLVQYTLAVDRNNDKLNNYYIQHHPAVLNLIQLTIKNAKEAGIPVSVCGEMASISEYVPLLIGLGITDLSVNPNRLLEVKAIVRKCDAALFDTILSIPCFETVDQTEKLIYHTLKAYYE